MHRSTGVFILGKPLGFLHLVFSPGPMGNRRKNDPCSSRSFRLSYNKFGGLNRVVLYRVRGISS